MTFIVLIEDDSEWGDLCVQYFTKQPIVWAQDVEHARKLISVAKNQKLPVVFLVDTSLEGQSGHEGVVLTHEIQESIEEFYREPLILSISVFEGDEMNRLGVPHVGKDVLEIAKHIKSNEERIVGESEHNKIEKGR